ncbi:cytochrome c-type biogenesis protein CcmH [Thalassobaculum fulvum]|jgi:cytochrome c-type biogenesis protein CcmH|uniref:Cytochrome c-type biogenesis protein n=1 Tax=Thalassobaculum fulvum TaxID=1633335 RepID=A0A919CPG5_9PROT|nr:cytochrome c-type biogenesis protein [Thalassobaculum fulvum]GHD42990.1 cytochrome c-type biogenesis protein CcmH [Thalassobaculum fulvum]
MTGRRVLRAAALAAVLFGALPAGAVQPDEMLRDPALEQRARELSAGVRCLVCQNQSIDDSNADLARDLRKLVRERLLAGDTDQQVLDYLTARYGPFVLLEPPKTRSTWLLWYGPFALLAVGAAGVAAAAALRARRRAEPEPLSAEERSRLEALLSDEAAGTNEDPR